MKRIKLPIYMFFIAILLVVSLTLGACSGTSTTSTANSSTATTQTTTQNAEAITLVFNGQEMANSIYVTDFFTPWFAAIEQKTGGKVKIEAHWGEQLVKSADSFMAIKSGIIDMAQLPVMSLPNDFPMDVIAGFTSYDTVCYGRSQVWYDLYKQFPEMQNEYKDTKVLWLGTAGATYLGTVKKPVRTLEDLKGLKIMSTGGWDADRGTALGWTPVTVGPADFFTSLQTGILDGSAFAPFTLRDFKVGELLHYGTIVPVFPTLFAVAINNNRWNSLPADVQKQIEEMSLEYIKINDDFQNKLAADRMSTANKEFGMEVITPSTQELGRWVAADKPVLDKFISQLNAKGLPGDNLKTKYLELEKKYADQAYAPK
jgi:TRAP-type C4-dicarboxylate transport system substrate-binding protein